MYKHVFDIVEFLNNMLLENMFINCLLQQKCLKHKHTHTYNHEQIISCQQKCVELLKHDISIIECLPSTWHVIYCKEAHAHHHHVSYSVWNYVRHFTSKLLKLCYQQHDCCWRFMSWKIENLFPNIWIFFSIYYCCEDNAA